MKIWIIEPDRISPMALLKDRIRRMSREMQPPSLLRPPDPIHEEKRLYERVPCFLLVDYVSQGCAYRSFIKNISADGAFIESHRHVPTGPEIDLVISFREDQNPIKITGRRVWIGEQGIGVRFHPVRNDVLHTPG
jgi:hypothetical protein